MITLIFIFVFLLTDSCGANSCPDDAGWFPAAGSCYLMSPYKMNWYKAQEVKCQFLKHKLGWSLQFCWEHGGYLAEIKTSEIEQELDEVLLHEVEYWIGLTDLDSQETFYWAESGEEATYFNWGARQPDNNRNEDCVFKSLTVQHSGWQDMICTHDNSYFMDLHALCQYQIA